ncbi:NUDIX domain-containing protein [Dysgonomonas sp. 520]|uniref:NUDIX hydrolase n=1 Tax=Dysgonomonas sp. 520 TaxID=2302931 RepID=UPI0013D2A7E6|nr:NUDIX domain-containing protein [Dysgonomonas sp. 520]NDW10290.1 NUDIX hydrolase [Dysgonomonas sp. 520]
MQTTDVINEDLLSSNLNKTQLQPGFVVNCVILAFFEGHLKVLLNKFNLVDKWVLPGGFVRRDEGVDEAALRIATERTKVNNIYIHQYHLFGDKDRIDLEQNKEILRKAGVKDVENHWFAQRFIAVGYYALVDYTKVVTDNIDPNFQTEWHDLNDLPSLFFDHNKMIHYAIESIRMKLGYVPIGYELLPDKFTMPELRAVYESIIGRPLDRRNFQRKMLSVGLVRRLDETQKKKAHKAPFLYEFITTQYETALEFGMQLMPWNNKDL